MKKNIKKIIFCWLFFFSWSIYSQAGSVDNLLKDLPEGIKSKYEKFLSFETNDARMHLSEFSSDELEQIKNAYEGLLNKSGKSEKRILWIVEEAEARKADKIAADRLFYVALAVIILMVLFTGFVVYIYLSQKKLFNQL
ncbi:MAG: hypothetical protein OEZ22_12090 [Spirochaetia bacterium]|nr:hypothetical protein [Spirochaetia bacterium]